MNALMMLRKKKIIVGVDNEIEGEKVKCIYTEISLKNFLGSIGFTGVMSIDLETTGLDFYKDEIIAVGIGIKLKRGWEYGIVNFCSSNTDISFSYLKDSLQYFYKKVKTVVSHNFNFEYKMIRNYFNIDIDGYHRYCTLVASWFLDENRLRGYGLDSLSETVNIHYNKDEVNFGKVFDELDENQQVRYLGKDIIACSRLYDKTKKELEDQNLLDLFLEQEMVFNWTNGLMEWNGVYVNKPKIYDILLNANHLLRRIRKSLKRIAGSDFKPTQSASKQLTEVLFKKMKLKPLRYGSSQSCNTCGKILTKKTYYKCNEHPFSKTEFIPSSDAKTLNYYADRNNKFCKSLLEYRNISKLKSTYIEPLPYMISSDNRIHTSYKQHGTKTGRLSSSNPNSQNFPTSNTDRFGIRSLFVAKKGSVFIDGDYSQLEPRILAHFSKDKVLLETYNKGMDIYSYGATKMFGKKYEDCGKGTFERMAMKTITLGLNYGMGGEALSKNLGVSKKKAYSLINDYKSVYADVFGKNGYKDWVINQARKNNGVAYTLLGRPRRIKELFDEEDWIRSMAERQLFNSVIQGSASDILRLLQIRFYSEFSVEELEYIKMIFQIHDELLFEVKEKYADEYKIRIDKIAEDFSDVDLELNCPLKFESIICDNWGEGKG